MSVNLPATGWVGSDGAEYTSATAVSLVDTAAVGIVDTAGVAIIDTGVSQTPFPATAWTENDAS